ncbi:hypothetical protein T06_13899 [Trichinella sp. T6]|nr:hypothetical protein T06_13899 [Trichinella sp. T6]
MGSSMDAQNVRIPVVPQRTAGARAWAHALASKKILRLFAQSLMTALCSSAFWSCSQSSSRASVSRKSASLNSSWPDSTFSSTASMLSSNSSVRRRFNQSLFAASFLDSAFAAVVISHDCYAYSLIGCRGIRIGGPKCTNRLGVLYACDAQVRRHQARLTAAGEELTVSLGSSWPTEYGHSRKRSSELNASGSSNATNTCSFIRQETIRGTCPVDRSKQRVNTYTGTSNDTRTNGK